MLQRVFWITLFCLLGVNSYAQTPFYWAHLEALGGSTRQHITVLDNGEVFVTGVWDSHSDDKFLGFPMKLGSFIIKYDVSGDVIWVKSFDGDITGIEHDPLGNIYLSGHFLDAYDYDSQYIQALGRGDGYIAKLNSEGEYIWVKTFGGTSEDKCDDIAWSNGYVVAVGTTQETMYIGQEDSIPSEPNRLGDGYIVRFDDNGSFTWGKRASSSYGDILDAVGIDNAGNIYAGGKTNGIVQVDTHTLRTPFSGYLTFVVKIDRDGETRWLHTPQDSAVKECSALEAYSNGGCVFAATDYSRGQNIMIRSLNDDGSINWSSWFGSGDVDVANGLGVDAEENVFLTGTADAEKKSLANYSKVFISAFNNQGSEQWVFKTGDHNNSLAVPSSGYSLAVKDSTLYCTGTFDRGITFGDAYLQPKYRGYFLVKMATFGTVLSYNENDEDREGEHALFPNPASAEITLEFPESENRIITIFNMQGAALLRTIVRERSVNVDISNLSRGTYIVYIESNEQVQTYRVIVE